MTQPLDLSQPPDAIDVIDVIDNIVGLTPGSPLHTLRHQRDKVAVATQGSYDALFDAAVDGLSATERLLVALHACSLSQSQQLSAHYRSRLMALKVDSGLLAMAESPSTVPVAVSVAVAVAVPAAVNPRLQAMLAFTHTLITNPIAGDKPALMALTQAGLTTPAIVALAQLIAFLSYQLRVVAGLQAMSAMQADEPEAVSA